MQNSVYIAETRHTELYKALADSLTWIEMDKIVRPGDRVFLKPNFTYPFFKPGVTTSPQLIEALVVFLKQLSPGRIIIGESDGGTGSWTADDSFEGHGLRDIASKYGVRVVNLSRLPSEDVQAEIGGKTLEFPLPSLLLNDIDIFITLPVPKIHAKTGVSLAFKNQWGCIPDPWRIRHHPQFAHKIVAINNILSPKAVIFDGTFFLNENGPMKGIPVRKDLVIASDSLGAGSLACCEIMGIDPRKINHLRVAEQAGLVPPSLAQSKVNVELRNHIKERFFLKRTPQDWVSFWAFGSKFGTNLLYLWPTAKPLHKMLYAIKGKPKDFRPAY